MTTHYAACHIEDRSKQAGGGIWRRALAFVAFHLSCTLAMILILAGTPEPNGRLAAVFPPWYDVGDVLGAIVASNGRLVRFGRAPWIAVVAPSRDSTGLQSQLKASGALAFINPQIAGGCDITTTASNTR